MLIGGILLGLILGLLAGGSILNLASVRLRWVGVLLLAVILRFGTEYLLIRGNAVVEALRLPLFMAAFGLLLAALWVNRSHPGLRLAFVGILLNTIAIAANGGYMPIWEPSLLAAGFTVADVTPFHVLLPPGLNVEFLRHAGPLADILPIPVPIIRNVASIGDVFLTAGLAFFLFATVVRPQGEPEEEAEEHELTGLAGTARVPRSPRERDGRPACPAGDGARARTHRDRGAEPAPHLRHARHRPRRTEQRAGGAPGQGRPDAGRPAGWPADRPCAGAGRWHPDRRRRRRPGPAEDRRSRSASAAIPTSGWPSTRRSLRSGRAS
jgi:hypothetical protein